MASPLELRCVFTRVCLAAAVLGAAGQCAAQTAPPVQGVVSYETRQVIKAGVTRVETWQENMYRQGDTVWTERLVPGGHLDHGKHAHDGKPEATHKHLDIDTSARWLQKDLTGTLQLRYVNKDEKLVVTIPKAEFGTVGFDGRWDAAAYLVPSDVVAKMKPAGEESKNTVWRTEQTGGWTHRVLWSKSLQIALQIESKKTDGSFSRTIRLKPNDSMNPTAPWEKLNSFEQKKYDDFMD